MKKCFLTSGLIFVSAIMFSNPIMPPGHVFSEICFEGDSTGWVMELYFVPEWQGWAVELADFYLTSSSSGDSAIFKSGMFITFEEPIVVTANDLVNPLSINPEGDKIFMVLIYGSGYGETIDYLSFGDTQEYTWVYAPDTSQSIARHRIVVYPEDDFYYFGLESFPTMGSNAMINSTRTNLTGYVFDAMGDPVPGAEVNCFGLAGFTPPGFQAIFSNENGYFENQNMFSKRYLARIYLDYILWQVDTIDLYVDSLNYYEFYLDSLYTGKAEKQIEKTKTSLMATPNPFSNSLNIQIQTNDFKSLKNGYLYFYNYSGQLAYAKSINSPYLTNMNIQIHTSDIQQLKPGMYIVQFVGNDQLLATEKIIHVE